MKYSQKNGPEETITLYGISMGAATVMMTSGEDLPKNVTSIIEDCGYTNVNEELGYQLDQLFGLPAFPLTASASPKKYPARIFVTRLVTFINGKAGRPNN